MGKIAILVGFFCASQAFAQAEKFDKMKQQNDAALKETQELLATPASREKAVKDDQKAKAAHEYAKKVSGTTENLNEMYGISSDIFAYLAAAYGSDPKKLEEVIVQAQKDPAKFYDGLPPEIKNKVRGLASKIPVEQPPQH